jgi:hypothetical protein
VNVYTDETAASCFEFAKAAQDIARMGVIRTSIAHIDARCDAAMIAGKGHIIREGGTDAVSALVDLLLIIRLIERSRWNVSVVDHVMDADAAKIFRRSVRVA